MKKILYVICAFAVLCNAICVAQPDSYKDAIDNMSKKTEELAPYVGSDRLDGAVYDKWYKEFSAVSDEFGKTYSFTHKNRASFKLARQAIDELSSVWNMLRSAKQADEMYVESITSSQGDAQYAHKWKKTASSNRKSACDSIGKVIKLFKDAKASLSSEV